MRHSQRELAAYHEAGHAVVGYLRGQRVRERGISVDSIGNGHAHVHASLPIPRAQMPEELLAMADDSLVMQVADFVGGYAAEWKVQGRRPARLLRPWESDDYRRAVEHVAVYWSLTEEEDWPEVERHIRRGMRRATSLLNRQEVWAAVETLAALLKAAGYVSDDQANKILSLDSAGSWLPDGTQVGAAVS